MPAMRTHDDEFRILDVSGSFAIPSDAGIDDIDDDMPPLVDKPSSMSSMPWFQPYDFEVCPDRFEVIQEDVALPSSPFTTNSPSSPSSPVDDSDLPPLVDIPPSEGESTTDSFPHANTTSAPHIPRPPNAFILFRASFIKSQIVPSPLETSHSTLSQIAGLVWKAMPRGGEEKKEWEEKAQEALREHKRMYPDWRFRMMNINSGGGGKDKPGGKGGGEGDGGGKGRQKQKPNRPPLSKAARSTAPPKKKLGKEAAKERCAHIASLLAKGTKGAELERMMKLWDEELEKRGPRPVMVSSPATTSRKKQVKLKEPKELPTKKRPRSESFSSPSPASPTQAKKKQRVELGRTTITIPDRDLGYASTPALSPDAGSPLSLSSFTPPPTAPSPSAARTGLITPIIEPAAAFLNTAAPYPPPATPPNPNVGYPTWAPEPHFACSGPSPGYAAGMYQPQPQQFAPANPQVPFDSNLSLDFDPEFFASFFVSGANTNTVSSKSSQLHPQVQQQTGVLGPEQQWPAFFPPPVNGVDYTQGGEWGNWGVTV